jgi:hypothetical protein
MDGVCDLQTCSKCPHWMAAVSSPNASARGGKRVHKQSQSEFLVLRKKSFVSIKNF